MNSQPDPETALRETIRAGRAVIVAGTGVSIAASFDAATNQPHPQASWVGLLEDGLKWLKDHRLIDDEIADAQLKLLTNNPRTHRFISAAEDVTSGLGGEKSPHFAGWLKRTVGSIKACDRNILDALDAIRQQGNLLATTNYDELLLSGNSRLAPVTWLETDDLMGVVRAWDTNRIIFLHGYWRQPESVILDWKSYERIARDERYREDIAAFWKTSIWVYVGCGVNGITDPDFGLLLERYGERARQAGHWDYCLVRDSQRDEFQAHFDTHRLNIRAIPFGRDNADLPQYLRSLLPAPILPAAAVLPTPVASAKAASRVAQVRSLYLKEASRDIEARLAGSIHHARFIDLGIQDDPTAIKPAWGYINPETRQSYESVAEAFVGCDRRLLLLGAPGSGKTTALLHLAKLLALDAEQGAEAPIPFVFNVSKFRFRQAETTRLWPTFGKSRGDAANGEGGESGEGGDREFEDWLVSEMAAFPGLSREQAREWIGERQVAILIDGLDEFNDERRADLVRLLNHTFLRHYPDLIVTICSRTNEYLALRDSQETRLQLRGCVHLQPLTDAQIASYLDAAQATALLQALPDDPALRDLAATPLTLSMLVLAYGGVAPTDLPAAGSLSESRHHLFESYVARMLQRQARRDRNIPFDDSRANDIPISEYQYRPDQIHRWLGWLALVLSVRMRTTFSVRNFHSLLRIGVQPGRQPFNFCATYLAIGPLLAMALCLIALPIVPLRPEDWSTAASIVIALFLLLPLVAFLKASDNTLLYGVIVLFGGFLVFAAGDQLRTILPGSLSLLPLSSLLFFAMLLILIAQPSGFNSDDFRKCGLSFVGGLGAVLGLHFLPIHLELPPLLRDQWPVAIIAVSFGLAVVFFVEVEGMWEKIKTFGAGAYLPVFFTFFDTLKERDKHTQWTLAFIVIGAFLALTIVFTEISTGSVLILVLSAIVFLVGAVGNHSIAMLAAPCSLLAYFIWVAAKRTWSLDKNVSVANWRTLGENAADGTARLLDRMILSRCLWQILFIGGRFPQRRDRFIGFCTEAFFLKKSSQDYEFIHRLLRDYFALRALRPRLLAADERRRLDAIRFLGYQGEAALDVLIELAKDEDAAVRAAAITGLSHIASPIVTSCFTGYVDDPSPLVRVAVIPGILRLPEGAQVGMLSRLEPLGDGCEVGPLLDFLSPKLSGWEEGKIYNAIVRLGDSAMGPLKHFLRSRNKGKRTAAAGALAQFCSWGEKRLLSVNFDGRYPWVDPKKWGSRARVAECTRRLHLTKGQVIAHYKELAERFELRVKL